MSQPTVTVIGTGALGSALAKALYQEGYSVSGLYNRTLEKAETLAKEVKADHVSTFPSFQNELGTLVFLTVRDAEITQTVSLLDEIANNLEGYTIVHCSGNEPSDILEPLQKKGAQIAAFHPLQTFTATSEVKDFEGIYFDIEADKQTFKALQIVANALGSKTLDITKEAKPYLHAAAVVASNYLVTLLDASGSIAKLGDIDQNEAVTSLLPLVRKTIKNIESGSTSESLTGPIMRGDVETVRTHLQLLKQDNDMLTLYKKMGLQTLHLANKKKRFSEDVKAELLKLLK